MRKFFIKLLGGIDKLDVESLLAQQQYIFDECVKKYQMQAAWAQTKEEYKHRSIH